MENTQLVDQVEIWKHSMLEWLRVFFPNEVLRPGQLEAVRELSKIVSAKVKRHEKLPMTEEENVYANKRGLSLQSGQGYGKSRFLALAIWWFQTTFFKCHIMAASSTDKQLKNTLWSKLAEMKGYSNKFGGNTPYLETAFIQSAEKIYHPDYNGMEWFVEGIVAGNSAHKTGAVSAAGRHQEYQLFVADESSDIPDAYFQTIEGTSSDPVSVSILAFNPTQNMGYAIDTQTCNRSQWVPLHWSVTELPEFKDHVELAKDKYGEESNFYRVRILGYPPITDSDSLIPFEWVMRAVAKTADTPNGRVVEFDSNEKPPKLIAGLDVGGGGDNSVIYLHQGGKFINMTEYSYADSDRLIGATIDFMMNWDVDALYVDNVGIGQPVYHALKNNPHLRGRVFPCDVRRASTNNSFCKYRDQIWWKIRELFEKNMIQIPKNDNLISQLTSIKYREERSGAIKVESKTELEARNIKSPNMADAVIMSYAVNDKIVEEKHTIKASTGRGYSWRNKNVYSNQSWMTA